jgi:AcrR family transcriptional regulator
VTVAVRLPAAERRQQLLDVALESFGSHGYTDTSMNRLAQAAGVTKPVLYQHFVSKRDLFLEVLRDIGGRLRAAIGAATAAAPTPRAQVEAGFLAYFRFFADRPAAFAVLFDDSSRRDREFAAEAHLVEAHLAETLTDLIAIDDLSLEDRRILAFGIVGMAESTSRYWVSRGLDFEPEAVATTVAELAWFGLRGRVRRG